MKRLSILLIVTLFFPLGSVHAFSWTSPLHSELGTPGNPLRVQITNVSDFRPPAYCSYLPGFLARWSQFSACAPVVTQRNFQSTLTNISNSLEEQNRIARDAQLRSLVFPVRQKAPVYLAPAPVVHNPAPTNVQPDPAVIQSIIDQVSAGIAPVSNCGASGNCGDYSGGGSAAGGSL